MNRKERLISTCGTTEHCADASFSNGERCAAGFDLQVAGSPSRGSVAQFVVCALLQVSHCVDYARAGGPVARYLR